MSSLNDAVVDSYDVFRVEMSVVLTLELYYIVTISVVDVLLYR